MSTNTTPTPVEDAMSEATTLAIAQTEKALRPVEQEYADNPSQGVFWFTANIFHIRRILSHLAAQAEALAEKDAEVNSLLISNKQLLDAEREFIEQVCAKDTEIAELKHLADARKLAADSEHARVNVLEEALQFYATDDAMAVEMGIQARVEDRPATAALRGEEG